MPTKTISFIGIIAIFWALAAKRTADNNDTLCSIIPNALLFTPSPKVTEWMWGVCNKSAKKLNAVGEEVPTIPKEEYSWAKMEELSEGWTQPVVVRGLFADSDAVKKWDTDEHLPGLVGKYPVPVVQNGNFGSHQNIIEVEYFKDAFQDIRKTPGSIKSLFFPVLSRFASREGMDQPIENIHDKIYNFVTNDLGTSRLGPEWEASFQDPERFQLIMAQGSESLDNTTGTYFHCAPGGNWFVQVVGRKMWYFVDPKYSAYMDPLRNGKVSIAVTNNEDMWHYLNKVPYKWIELSPGDLLINPPFYWHAVKNRPGFSAASIMRIVDLKTMWASNPLYTAVILWNKIFDRMGIDLGGYDH